MTKGYDLDGVVSLGVEPEPGSVIISGRTWAEYDALARKCAQRFPTYIRGVGASGDREAAAKFKAKMIAILDIDEFYEDDPMQAHIIAGRVMVHINLVTVDQPDGGQ